MDRRKFPIGIQTFREIREDGHCYVDKTGYAKRLIDEGKRNFLSRPRRFGKSLFVDTLKELFEGNEAPFEGLAVPDGWDWSVRHPVVRPSFSRGNFGKPGYLDEDVAERLEVLERQAGIDPRPSSAPARFSRLLRLLHERTGQRVVVLVDEYDSRSSTSWGSRNGRGRTVTICTGSTRPSRTGTPTSGSASSPG